MTSVFEMLVEHGVTIVIVALIMAALSLSVSWISRMFAKIHVQGKWETTLNRDGKDAKHEIVQLHQFLSRVWGQTKTKDAESRVYQVSGRIVGDKLCMVYRQAKGDGFDCGAILLSIMPGGKMMEGYEVGINLATSGTYSYVYKWSRS